MKIENQQPEFKLSNEDSSDIISMESLLYQIGANPKEEEKEEDEITDIDTVLEKALDKDKEEDEDSDIKPLSEIEADGEEELEEGEPADTPKVEYKSVIKSIWGDEIEMIAEEGEDGEVIERSIDDVNIDEKMFVDIVKSKLAEMEDTYKSRVSTEDISDFTKHIISIEKNGGSVREAIELYNTYQDPLSNLDLEEESDQIKAVHMRYKAQGMDESEIKDMIDAFKIKGNLKERSHKAKEELDDAVKAKMAAMNEKAVKDKEKHEQALKQYKKDMKESISNYNIKDSLKSKIVDMATKRGEDNSYELDKLYNQIRLNPEQVGELALYMLDREAFIKKVSEKEVTEAKKKTFKTLSLIPDKQRKTTKSDNSSKSNEVDLEELIN